MKTYLYVHATTGLTFVADALPTFKGNRKVKATFGRTYWETDDTEWIKGSNRHGLLGEELLDAKFFRRITNPTHDRLSRTGCFYVYVGQVS